MKLNELLRDIRPHVLNWIKDSVQTGAQSSQPTQVDSLTQIYTTVVQTGVAAHSALTGLIVGDDHPQYTLETREVNSGVGLTGGGDLTADRALSLAPTVAGAGLVFNTGVLNVGQGDGLLVSADSVALDYHVAGAGLTFSSGVLDVGQGDGLLVSADSVAVDLATAPPTPVDLTDGYVGDLTKLARTDHQHHLSEAIVPHWTGIHAHSSVIKGEGWELGLQAWAITPAGWGDFRKLTADQLHVKAFIADIEQALAGGQVISKSVAILADDFAIPARGDRSVLTVESFAGFPNAWVYVAGDVIRLRSIFRPGIALHVTDCWGTVALGGIDVDAKTQSYWFTRSVGSLGGDIDETSVPVLGKGALALDYGASGDGFIETLAVGPGTPYTRAVTWTGHPATGQHTRTMTGNLYGLGWTEGDAQEFGFYAGDGTDATNSFLRISNLAASLNNIPLVITDNGVAKFKIDNTPSLAAGSVLPAGYGTGTGIWLGKHTDGTYRFRVGNPNANQLTWDGTKLTIQGSGLQLDTESVVNGRWWDLFQDPNNFGAQLRSNYLGYNVNLSHDHLAGSWGIAMGGKPVNGTTDQVGENVLFQWAPPTSGAPVFSTRLSLTKNGDLTIPGDLMVGGMISGSASIHALLGAFHTFAGATAGTYPRGQTSGAPLWQTIPDADLPVTIARTSQLAGNILAGGGLGEGTPIGADRVFQINASSEFVIHADSISISGTIAGDGLLWGDTDHDLNVGQGDGIIVNYDYVAVDSTVVRTTRTITAGDGLVGGGTLAADHSFDVDGTVVRTSRVITAGAGLTGGGTLAANRSLDVGAGDGISVAADSVAVNNTVVRTSRTLTAGAGLTGTSTLATDVTFNVGAGSGVTVNADSVALTWGTPIISTVHPDDAASAGTSANPARSDHTHAAATGVAGAVVPGASAAEGVATSFARSDHAHSVATAAPGANSVSLSAPVVGTSTSFARADHTHSLAQSIVPTWSGLHTFQRTTEQLRLGYDAGHYASLTVNQYGNLAIAPNGGTLSTPTALTVGGATDLQGVTIHGAASIAQDLIVGGGTGVLNVDVSGYRVGINCAADPQFDLDMPGSMRVGGYYVGRHALQIKDALLIAHFDGKLMLGDYSGTAEGHMGQKPTTSTAAGLSTLPFVPGKFGKAVQVAEATTNLIANPDFETNVSGWILTGSNPPTVSRLTENSYTGSASAYVIFTGANSVFGTNLAAYKTLLHNTAVTFSAWVNSTNSGTVRLAIQTNYSTGASGASAYHPGDGQWHRLTFTCTPVFDVGGTTTFIYAAVVGGAASTYAIVDAVQFEQKAYATPPVLPGMPGVTANGSAWVRTAGFLYYGTQTISPVFTLMTWANFGPGNKRDTSSAWYVGNSQLSAWRDSSGGLTLGGVAVTGLADGPHHLAISWDGTTCTAYVDGALRGVTTPGAQTLSALFAGGAVGYEWNDWVDDLVLVSRVCPAKEILAIFESDAPLFAETSTFTFRAGGSLVWADEEGLWMRDKAGGAVLGAYGGETPGKSWGGTSLDQGDLQIGNATSGVLWDQSASLLTVKGVVEITSGSSGYAALTDKPTLGTLAAKNAVDLATGDVTNKSLAYVDSAQNTKLNTVGGWAHASDTTKIDGGDIYTGSVTAAKITVTNLAALSADLGAVTAGSIVVGSANKLWLNEAADGVLAVGGTTKASAPFHVSAAGVLNATGAVINGSLEAGGGAVNIDASGIIISGGVASQNAINWSTGGAARSWRTGTTNYARFEGYAVDDGWHSELQLAVQGPTSGANLILSEHNGTVADSYASFKFNTPQVEAFRIMPTGVAVGTSPAASGAIRLPNNAWITARNAANTGDVNLARVNTSNQVEIGANLSMKTAYPNDESSAGLIGYRTSFGTDSLCLVGAGTTAGSRKVHLWDDVTIDGRFGCNGATAQPVYTVRADATDLATALTLVNQLRGLLRANGIAA